MANYLNAQGGNPNTHNWGKGNYLEGAFGYYKPLDKETIFEVYSGIGASNQQHHYLNGITTFTSTSNGSVNMSFAKLFIQPSLGITFNGVDFAFSSRLSYLSFYQIKNNILDSARDFQFVDTISKNRNSLLLEPAITIRGGWKYTKLQLQFVFQKNLNNPNLRFITGNLSLGLYISLAKRFRRNETSTN